MSNLQDKKSIFHVLSGLILEPERMSKTKQYKLDKDDFPEMFHKSIFSAMFDLFENGAEKISSIEIDGYLSTYTKQYDIFNANDGLSYLEDLENLGETENFDYHFNRVKKFTFLRTCKKIGIDMKDIYDDKVVDLGDEETQNDRFNSMSLEEIIKHVESKMIGLRDEFLYDQANTGSHMSDNVQEMIEERKSTPNYGANLSTPIITSITRGARLRKFYMTSGNSGSGKTRSLLSNLLTICVPIIWDEDSKEWVKTGATGKGLFISTELEEEEIKIPAVCFIACVEEDKIHDASLTPEEEARVDMAYQILTKTNIWFEELNDFDDDDIEHIIEKNINKYGVQYVAFDYLHSTMKIFESVAKRGAKNLQEHQILRIISMKLKLLCNKYNVWISTGTQLNDNYKTEGNLDQSSLAGSKSVVDKLDYGAIQIPLTDKDEKFFDELKQSINYGFGLTPTHTINIYKNRGNKWKSVRVWVHFDLGTLRMTDCFVTDYSNRLITDIKPKLVVLAKPLEENPKEEIEIDELPDSFNIWGE